MAKTVWIYTNKATDIPEKSILTSYLSETKRLFNNNSVIEDLLSKRSYLTDLSLEPKVSEYFNTDHKDIYQIALNIIVSAIKNRKDILIFGDFDVDGCTSTAALYLVLKSIYQQVKWIVPNRLDEGYGLNVEGVVSKVQPGSLVITVDNGISCVDEIDKLNELGYTILVTDHHTPDMDNLPKASHILNPKLFSREEIGDEFEAPGVFVASKLAYKLMKFYNIKNSRLFRDIVTFCGFGIISDVIELNPMMRKILWTSLAYLHTTTHDGLKALLHMCGVRDSQPISSTFLSYNVIPKLNAAGRMGSANSAIDLLLLQVDDSINHTNSLLAANGLKYLNADRKIVESTIFLEAKNLVDNEIAKYPNSIVVYKPGWHSGVLGIIAARLTETYHVPAIVLTEDKGTIKGSGRSINNFDIYNTLEQCKNLLIRYGGHTAACGLELSKDNLLPFKDKFEKIVSESDISKDTEFIIDADINILNIYDVRFHMFLNIFEPYGRGNPSLIFRLHEVTIRKSEEIKDVLNLYVEDKAGFTLKVTKYRPPKEWTKLEDKVVDILITPNFTYFTGNTIPDFRILDIKLSEELK